MGKVFEEVSTSKKFVDYSKLKQGEEILIGTFAGFTPNRINASASDSLFKTDEGTYQLSGGSLAYDMKVLVEEGTIVQNKSTVKVVYNGTEKISKGKFAGKETHKFRILVAKEDEVEVEEMALVVEEQGELPIENLEA